MAAIATEGRFLADAIRWEAASDYCRDVIVIVAGSGKVPITALVGRRTSDGKYAPHDPDATDGTQNVAGILCSDVDATSSDIKGLILLRGPAIVKFSECAQVNELDVSQETAAKAALRTLLMKVV
jgi:hypothetical protein